MLSLYNKLLSCPNGPGGLHTAIIFPIGINPTIYGQKSSLGEPKLNIVKLFCKKRPKLNLKTGGYSSVVEQVTTPADFSSVNFS